MNGSVALNDFENQETKLLADLDFFLIPSTISLKFSNRNLSVGNGSFRVLPHYKR